MKPTWPGVGVATLASLARARRRLDRRRGRTDRFVADDASDFLHRNHTNTRSLSPVGDARFSIPAGQFEGVL